MLKISAAHRPAQYSPIFQKFGRMHIPDFLETASATLAHDTLAAFDAWTRVLTVSEDVARTPRAIEADILAADKVRDVERVVTPPGQDDIQFLFDIHSIVTVRPKPVARDPRLAGLGDFINGPDFLAFARALTGDARIHRCDAGATRYLPGHFLTPHNDANAGERRLYAYVLNLSPRWKMEWGGVLAFIDSDGHVAEGYTPVFNALNVFRVPQQHAVTMVNHLARAPRYAVTGWMHAGG